MATGIPQADDKSNQGKPQGRWVRFFRGAVSVVVLGGFLTIAFGDVALEKLYRYRFLSLEASSAWGSGPKYRLFREFEFTNEQSESRRLFVFEGTGFEGSGDTPSPTRVVLTDQHYRMLSSVDFDKAGANFKSTLIQIFSPPILEVLTESKPSVTCLRFQLVCDQIVALKTGRPVYLPETAPYAS